MVTWWTVALGVTFGLIPVSRLSRSALIPAALLASIAVLTGLSFFWTNNEGIAFEKTVQMTCILGLFVLALLCSGRGSAREWLRGIAFGLAFLTLLALFSRFFPGLGDDAELRETLFGSAGRLSWPLGYWNAAGVVAAMAILTITWFAAAARIAPWRTVSVSVLPACFLVLYLTSSRGALGALLFGGTLLFLLDTRRKALVIATFFGLTGGAVLVLVAARMYDLVHAETGLNAWIEGISLLALSVAVTLCVALLFHRNEASLQARTVPRPGRLGWLLIGLLCVGALVSINPVKQASNFIAIPDTSQTRVEVKNLTNDHLLSATGNGRWQYWTAATNAFESEPLTGIGAGAYRDYYANHRENPLYGRHPHSLPLAYLGELGLVGFLLGASFLMFVLHTGWVRWRSERGTATAAPPSSAPDPPTAYLTEAIPPFAALILAGMVSMSIDWTSQFPVIAATVLISMAALVGPATLRKTSRESPKPDVSTQQNNRPGKLVPRDLAAVMTIIVSGCAILISTWGFGISLQLERSREALGQGDYAKASDEALGAVELAPWSSAALIQLAAAQEFSDQRVDALETLDRAAGQAPLDSLPWLAKRRVLLELGDRSGAMRSALRAKDLDPYSPYFEFIRIRAEQEAAALAEEQRQIKEAIEAERAAKQAAREEELFVEAVRKALIRKARKDQQRMIEEAIDAERPAGKAG